MHPVSASSLSTIPHSQVSCGGLGSYALVILIAAFLKQRGSSGEDGKDLGALLKDFLGLYGDLDYKEIGVAYE